MRWSLILFKYKFKIIYILKKDNERADALSRRDQDLLRDIYNDRLLDRHIYLLRPEVLIAHATVYAMSVKTRKTRTETEDAIQRPL
jgi:hypothetical protein